MLRDVLPLVFVRVSSLTLSTKSGPLLPKLRLAGWTDTRETTLPEPVPLRGTENAKGTLSTVVLTATAPATSAFTLGWKTTFIVQLCPPWRLNGQLLVCAKFPLTEI